MSLGIKSQGMITNRTHEPEMMAWVCCKNMNICDGCKSNIIKMWWMVHRIWAGIIACKSWHESASTQRSLKQRCSQMAAWTSIGSWPTITTPTMSKTNQYLCESRKLAITPLLNLMCIWRALKYAQNSVLVHLNNMAKLIAITVHNNANILSNTMRQTETLKPYAINLVLFVFQKLLTIILFFSLSVTYT